MTVPARLLSVRFRAARFGGTGDDTVRLFSKEGLRGASWVEPWVEPRLFRPRLGLLPEGLVLGFGGALGSRLRGDLLTKLTSSTEILFFTEGFFQTDTGSGGLSMDGTGMEDKAKDRMDEEETE